MPTREHTHPRPSNSRFYAVGSVAVALMLALGLFLGASVGQAHNIISPVIPLLEFPDLSVNAEGTQYSRAGATAYAWKADLFIFPGHTAAVKKWEVWPVIGGDLSLRSFGVSKTYPFGNRPNEVDKVIGHVIYASVLEDFAVELCTANANQLRQQGKSNDWIFGRQHQLEFQVELRREIDIRHGVDSHLPAGGTGHHMRKVTCGAAPGVPGPTREPSDGPTRTPPDISVENSSLITIEQVGLNGLCRVKTSGVITTAQPNTEVKFRYIDDAGHKSDVKTIQTAHSRTEFFIHQYDIPSNPNGLETGKIRLVGVSTPFQSPWSEYSMDCRDGKAPGGLANDSPKPGGGSPTGGQPTTDTPKPPRPAGAGTGSPVQGDSRGSQAGRPSRSRTDVAATELKLRSAGRKGLVQGRVDNLGTQSTRLRYVLVVRSKQGDEVFRKSGALSLGAGQHRAFRFDYPSRPAGRYEAELRVRATGDARPGNDRKTAASR